MTMMLHAKELQFTHPKTGVQLIITAGFQGEFKRMIDEMKFDYRG